MIKCLTQNGGSGSNLAFTIAVAFTQGINAAAVVTGTYVVLQIVQVVLCLKATCFIIVKSNAFVGIFSPYS